MSNFDKTTERNLYIVKELRKGHTRHWVASQLMEKYGFTELTAKDYVNKVGAELNKSLKELSEDAAEYIYNNLLATIDESIDKDDRKNKLKALELLSKVTKVTEDKVDVNVTFGFSFDDEK